MLSHKLRHSHLFDGADDWCTVFTDAIHPNEKGTRFDAGSGYSTAAWFSGMGR